MAEILRTNGLSDGDILRIVGTLKDGGVAILPCDTIYGFVAVRASEPRVRRIKRRETKPFLYLIHDLPQLAFFDIDGSAYADVLQRNWPGNITFIMADRRQTKTIGVRMPDAVNLQKIIGGVGQPLLSTSVNYAGESTLNNPDEIINTFAEYVDLIVIDDTYIAGAASTVVDLTSCPPRILRQGEKLYAG